MTDGGVAEKAVPIIIFDVSGEIWGVRFEEIRELIDAKAITAVPKTPPFVLGIISQRGNIVTIIDFACLTGKTVRTDVKESRIVRLQSDRMDIGFLIRSELSAASVAATEIGGKVEMQKGAGGNPLPVRIIDRPNGTRLCLLEKDALLDFFDREIRKWVRREKADSG
ncbi:MAG: chemotaxis protein CheW [Deltaproteobacteria bacterium]|nr:chemotaxis protein CheW [Deltaproteobacteria bacterium]